jgi:hypothetical protein
MNRALDEILVALALIVSVGYATLALGPKDLRKRLWAALAGRAERAPAGLLRGLARRLRAAAERSAGACGGCDSCAPETEVSTSGTRQVSTDGMREVSAGGPREVRVPFAKIGKRRR